MWQGRKRMDNSGQYSRLRPGIRIFCILPKQGRKENAEETKEGEGIWRKLVPEKGQREQGSGQCREERKPAGEGQGGGLLYQPWDPVGDPQAAQKGGIGNAAGRI